MKNPITLIIILLLLSGCMTAAALAGSTQTNTSGSNTAIEGGYTSTATTTYQTGSSSNSTTTNNSTSNTKSAPPSAGAPSFNSMTQDVCAVGVSMGVQTFGIGISGGKHAIDKNCERLKLARILNDFGMKVAAVAILCQDERVFESMIQAGTPCPIDGKIGKEAKQLWSKYDHERPDYKTYVKRMDDRKKADEAEQKRITKEMEAMDEAKAIADKKVENAKKMKEWKHPR
jgi:hypothetical protein|tara:strand:- start:230 stop:919 length:690 start_codon:yes stop_codon:yes gene_type:complete